MTESLLPCLLARTDADAASAWSRWRSATDIDALLWSEALTIAMMPADRLQRLSAGDPAAPILTGLVKRAWTHGSLRAAAARDLRRHLIDAGIGPVLIGGSIAAFLHGQQSGAIRPVTDIVLLVARDHLDRAVSVVTDVGWMLDGVVPPPQGRNWAAGVTLRRGDEVLRLAWRHVGTTPWRAEAAERALFARPSELVPLEPLLLSRLGARPSWDDLVPWQADVALFAAQPLDWDAVYRDAAIWASEAHDRLRAVRAVVAGVPSPSVRVGATVRLETALGAALRRVVLAGRGIMGRR